MQAALHRAISSQKLSQLAVHTAWLCHHRLLSEVQTKYGPGPSHPTGQACGVMFDVLACSSVDVVSVPRPAQDPGARKFA